MPSLAGVRRVITDPYTPLGVPMSELRADRRYIERPPMRVDLGEAPDGTKRWAELIDLDEVPRRLKFRVQEDILALINKGQNDEFPAALVTSRIHDIMIANLVTAWSFGDPPNKDIEPVMDLPNKAYEALVKAIQPYEDDLDFMKAGKAAQEEMARARRSEEPADITGSKDGSADTSSQDTSQTPA